MTSPANAATADEDPPPEGVGATRGVGGFDIRIRETGQHALFPAEDLVIPETLRTMRKAVSAIHATPIRAEHAQSLNNRRLFDAVILVAQLDFRKRGPQALQRVKNERLSPLFETRVTDLARLAGIPGKNYQRIYTELDQLFEMVLRWNVIGEEAGVEWEMKSHFLSSLGIGKDNKRGLIRFAFDPAVLEIVLEPSNWATLSLQAMEGMSTAASYALYQNTFRYLGTHAKVTAALPTATWVELLLGPCGYLEEDPVEGKRVVRYADFKRRVLLDAIRRVNESPALNHTIELKEYKSASRVVKLQFKFQPKNNPTLGLPLTWPQDVIAVLNSIGFSDREIEDMSQARSYEEVAESIVRLKEAEAKLRMAGRKIGSKKAYFNGILTNVAMGASMDDLDALKLEQEAQAQEAQRLAQQRLERLQEEFQSHSAQRFAAAVFELPELERDSLLTDFQASAAGKAALPLLKKGWTPQNKPALAVLRKWLSDHRVEDFKRLMPLPQDSNFEAWMAWRLEHAAD